MFYFQTNPVKLLPENLFVALECCLEDEHDRVQRAAAIALYTLEKPVLKVSLENYIGNSLKFVQ